MGSAQYNHILITTENGVNFCIEPKWELENCINSTADTKYINLKYNCTKCNFNYISYYSKFFERKICQNIYAKIPKEKDILLEKFESQEKTPAIDGT